MKTTNAKWTPFFFESNHFFDTIKGPEDWERLKAAYPGISDDHLLHSKEATYKGSRKQEERDAHPNYGMRLEHDGERTLRDFFDEHGMSLVGVEPSKASDTTEKVVELLRQRDAISLDKYSGKTMDRNDLSAAQWARHLIEEQADGIKYAMRMETGLLLLEEARTLIGARPINEVEAYWIKRYDEQFTNK